MSKPTATPQPFHSHTDAREGLTRIVRNSAINALGTALVLPFNFIALFTLARRLGKDSLGTFFTIFAISAVIHWIGDAGVATVLTHRIARAPNQLRRIVGEAYGMFFVVSLTSVGLFYLVCSVWMYAAGEQFSWMVLTVAAISIVTRHALDFASNAFRGLERFEFENLARVLQTGLFAFFVWIAVNPSAGNILSGFIAFMASNVIAAAFIVTVLVWKWRCTRIYFSSAIVRDWFKESLPLGFGDAVRRLMLQIDTLLLAALRPPGVVGLFSIAYRPLQPLQLLPRAIVSVTFPMMSRTAHSDRAVFSRSFARTTNLLWVASLPIALIISFTAEPLILATAGPDFIEAVWPFRLLIWAAPLMFINAQLRFAFTALDSQRLYWRLTSSVLVIKIILALPLIVVWGLYGACYAHLLGELLLVVGSLKMLRALAVRGPSWLQLARVIPAVAAMVAALLPIADSSTSLLATATYSFLSLLAYSVVCLLTGALPWTDVKQIWQVIPTRARADADHEFATSLRADLKCDLASDQLRFGPVRPDCVGTASKVSGS